MLRPGAKIISTRGLAGLPPFLVPVVMRVYHRSAGTENSLGRRENWGHTGGAETNPPFILSPSPLKEARHGFDHNQIDPTVVTQTS